VRVTLAGGEVVEGAVQRSAGGPDNPLSREQLLEKFFALAGQDARQLVDLLERIDELDSVEPVLAATHTATLGGPSA
jgi:2-methylcitrate dehydratase PrpD